MRSLSVRHIMGCFVVASVLALVPSVASASVFRNRFIHPTQCMVKPDTSGIISTFTSGIPWGQITNNNPSSTLVLWCPVPIDFYTGSPTPFPASFNEVTVDGWSTTCGAGSKGLRARFCYTLASGAAGSCTTNFVEPTNCSVTQHLVVQPTGSFPTDSYPFIEVELRGNSMGNNTFFGYRVRTCDQGC